MTWDRGTDTHTKEAVPVRKKRLKAVTLTAVRHWRKEQEGWIYSKVLEYEVF